VHVAASFVLFNLKRFAAPFDMCYINNLYYYHHTRCVFRINMKLIANNQALSITTTHERKKRSFYKTWCLLPNLRANQLSDVPTARRFPSCIGSCSRWRAAAPPGAKNCGRLALARLLLTTCSRRQNKSDTNLPSMHCDAIAGDSF